MNDFLSADQAKLAVIILTAIYVSIFTPISLFCAYQLWLLKDKNVPFVTKRHPKVVILTIILFIIYPMFVRPTANLVEIYYSHNVIVLAMGNLTVYLPGIHCTRFWLLYYDYSYGVHSLSIKWKSKVSDQTIPWTHKYKWLGNSKIVTAIPLILSTVFNVIIRYING